MQKNEIEIEIRPGGEVKIHVKGVKGKQCLSYVEFFKQVVGGVESQQLTHEFYEPETPVHTGIAEQLHVKDNG